MNKRNDCCQKCLGSYGFGKDNWGCIEKGCPCHHTSPKDESKAVDNDLLMKNRLVDNESLRERFEELAKQCNVGGKATLILGGFIQHEVKAVYQRGLEEGAIACQMLIAERTKKRIEEIAQHYMSFADYQRFYESINDLSTSEDKEGTI